MEECTCEPNFRRSFDFIMPILKQAQFNSGNKLLAKVLCISKSLKELSISCLTISRGNARGHQTGDRCLWTGKGGLGGEGNPSLLWYCLYNLDTQVGHLLLMSTVICWWTNSMEVSKSLLYLPQAVTFVNKMLIVTSLSLCSL